MAQASTAKRVLVLFRKVEVHAWGLGSSSSDQEFAAYTSIGVESLSQVGTAGVVSGSELNFETEILNPKPLGPFRSE